MQRRVFVLAAAAAACAPAVALGDAVTPSAAIARLFTSALLSPAWFTPLFLAQVSLDQIRAIVADIEGALGPYQSIQANGDGYTVAFGHGTVQANATLDAAGAFTALLFSRMQSPDAAERSAAVFNSTQAPAAWFSPRFLASVPIEKVRAVTAALKKQFGAFQSIAAAPDGTYTARFANGSAAVLIFLGADGKIEGLIVRPQ
jgi:hypothetical protein